VAVFIRTCYSKENETGSTCTNSDERNSECLASTLRKFHGNNHLENRFFS